MQRWHRRFGAGLGSRSQRQRRKYTIQKLVEVLARLTLQSSRDLAGVIGAACRTYLRKGNDNIVEQCLLQSGIAHNDQAKRMKDLERENVRLKRLVADLSLEKQVLKDVASGNL